MGAFYSNQGFIPLCQSTLTDKYYFKGNASISANRGNSTDDVIAQIQTTLMVCRIAHFLKVKIRTMLGSFKSAEECQGVLNRWIDDYCSNLVNADENMMAKYPLNKGRVIVKEIPGKQGQFSCDLLIQPQYQYDAVCGEVLLSTGLNSDESTLSSVGGI
ncbi:type VI secretion system contractile sheath large subunit [Vibrio sp. SS-MA-C1-2]|uniref:type VI secretion system contractile sheath large subunit n=1 Tax=Vibrio sp. SS-MA-C1-2 TaxID=2908646 RepID=UPI001F25BF4B|nr:type VI secretion system contractile sheath large subunit [Vibrio sp. SS-MA-C1-2]UJF17203.1 type VI secretion system contractile sheath large subunit [Vibrio sp. SS-MA-C1-2]